MAKVLSTPRCRECRGEKTTRLGFLKARGGSEYQCLNPDCKARFVVPTLRLNITETRRTK